MINNLNNVNLPIFRARGAKENVSRVLLFNHTGLNSCASDFVVEAAEFESMFMVRKTIQMQLNY